ncbi:FMN-binding protein [Bacteroidota bacterium]
MKKVIQMLVTLSLIGVVSGGVLSKLNGWAQPKIAAHRKAETERAIFIVQPNAKIYEKVEEVDFELYRVFEDSTTQVGYAMVYQGNGFAGNMRVMAGVTNDVSHIVGIQILEQTETPGLGTKVTEEPFTRQFIDLSTNPQVDYVKGVPPTNDNEIQAITGATISSKSVVAIINGGILKLKELVERGNL